MVMVSRRGSPGKRTRDPEPPHGQGRGVLGMSTAAFPGLSETADLHAAPTTSLASALAPHPCACDPLFPLAGRGRATGPLAGLRSCLACSITERLEALVAAVHAHLAPVFGTPRLKAEAGAAFSVRTVPACVGDGSHHDRWPASGLCTVSETGIPAGADAPTPPTTSPPCGTPPPALPSSSGHSTDLSAARRRSGDPQVERARPP